MAIQLLAVVGGVVVVGAAAAVAMASSSSSSSSSPTKLVRLAPLSMPGASKWTSDTRGEPYADPWDNLRDLSVQYPLHPGREYLRGVPADGYARADAMLAKVAGAEGSRALKSIDDLVTRSLALSAAGFKDQEKARKQVNSWVTYLGSAVGPAGAAVAALWVAASDFVSRWSSNSGSAAKARSLIEGASAELTTALESTGKRGFPIPLHLLDYLPEEGWVAPATADRMQHLALVAKMNAEKFDELRKVAPPGVLEALRAWWALFGITIGTHPHVERVARAMNGGDWGGLFNLGSDEQVLLVAAPIAADFGIDVRELTARLWTRNGGWSRSPELLWRRWTEGLEDGGESSWRPDVPSNASQVQFATLARDAFALAAEMKGNGPLVGLRPRGLVGLQPRLRRAR